jgi:hypothetical protein
MAYDQIVQAITLPANADLSAKQFYLGKIVSDSGVGEVAVAGNGEQAHGVIYEGGTSGQATKLAVGGVLKVLAGGNVTAGAYVASDADGKVVAVATGDKSLGVAINSGVSGDIVSVLWRPID